MPDAVREIVAPRRLLTRTAVEAITGLDKGSIYKLVRGGTFPRPVPLSGGRVGWLEAEIAEWIEARVQERDAGQRCARGRAARLAGKASADARRRAAAQ